MRARLAERGAANRGQLITTMISHLGVMIAVISFIIHGVYAQGDSGQFVLRLHLVWRAAHRLSNFSRLCVCKKAQINSLAACVCCLMNELTREPAHAVACRWCRAAQSLVLTHLWEALFPDLLL